MRRRTPRSIALAVAVLLTAGACTRGDDGDDATPIDSAPSTSAPDSVPATSAPSSTPTTEAMPATSSTECEDVPDPVDYPVGTPPRAYRPCAIPTELTTHVIRTGTGNSAKDGDTMIIEYTGVRAADGQMFDTSYSREVPLDFVLGTGRVIPGWDQALVGSTAGSLLKLDIPAALAYGDTPPGGSGIQPGDALTFMIEVRAVVAPVVANEAPHDLIGTISETSDQLIVTDVSVGDGATVGSGDTAIVHLVLARSDTLAVIVDTWATSDPLQIIMAPDQPLPGLVTGIEGSRVGSVRRIVIPADLAFGNEGNTQLEIPPGLDLIAVIEVVGAY